jgi:hypothetical protein
MLTRRVFEHLTPCKQIGTLHHQIRDFVQQLRAVVWQHIAPGRLSHSFLSGLHCSVDVGFGAGANLVIDFSCSCGRVHVSYRGRSVTNPFARYKKPNWFNTYSCGHF